MANVRKVLDDIFHAFYFDFPVTEKIKLAEILVGAEVCGSRGEAKNLIAQGGVRINSVVETNIGKDFSVEEILKAGKFLWVDIGRRKRFKVYWGVPPQGNGE